MPHFRSIPIAPGQLQTILDENGLCTGLVDMEGKELGISKALLNTNEGALVSDTGIKIDSGDPTWSWHDIIGEVAPKTSGANTPARAIINGGMVAGFFFQANDLCDFLWHIPHDYVPGTDILWHIHIEHTGTTISGNAVFDLFYRVGKRDGTYTAEKQLTITHNTVDLTTTPRLSNLVYETPMSSDAGSSILVPNSAFEVDTIIKGTLRSTTIPTLGGGGRLFIHTSDLHFQSNNSGTKLNAFPFRH